MVVVSSPRAAKGSRLKINRILNIPAHSFFIGFGRPFRLFPTKSCHNFYRIPQAAKKVNAELFPLPQRDEPHPRNQGQQPRRRQRKRQHRQGEQQHARRRGQRGKYWLEQPQKHLVHQIHPKGQRGDSRRITRPLSRPAHSPLNSRKAQAAISTTLGMKYW